MAAGTRGWRAAVAQQNRRTRRRRQWRLSKRAEEAYASDLIESIQVLIRAFEGRLGECNMMVNESYAQNLSIRICVFACGFCSGALGGSAVPTSAASIDRLSDRIAIMKSVTMALKCREEAE